MQSASLRRTNGKNAVVYLVLRTSSHLLSDKMVVVRYASQDSTQFFYAKPITTFSSYQKHHSYSMHKIDKYFIIILYILTSLFLLRCPRTPCRGAVNCMHWTSPAMVIAGGARRVSPCTKRRDMVSYNHLFFHKKERARWNN